MNCTVIRDAASSQWIQFQKLVRVIETNQIHRLVDDLCLVERMVQQCGLYAAGFISYEAASAFDPSLTVKPMNSFPLMWFGLYSEVQAIQMPFPVKGHFSPSYRWIPTVNQEEYCSAVSKIRDYIAGGETYQVNYTFRLRTPFTDDAWTFFIDLAQAQGTDYSAYIDMGRYVICSASPELFIILDGKRLISCPMKGTVSRGRTHADDRALCDWLHDSEKNRSENIMIVDMMRNDMGRIADIGSVQVSHLCEVEQYPTVWQMTSTVSSMTDASLLEIMAALFPCASVTGPPKSRTMQIIADLESTPRRAYTGCIGFIRPNRKAHFNVAIRTVLVDREEQLAEYGVGGGIARDSDIDDEFRECRIKAAVLTELRPDFSLLETMLWTPVEGCFLLTYHLRRLRESANYFDIPLKLENIQVTITECIASLPDLPHKIRLLVTKEGTVDCLISVHQTTPSEPITLTLASTPIDSSTVFLYHKTTNRRIYDDAKILHPDCDDIILWNERHEITETTTANIVVELNGDLVTPSTRCGLLPGTFRAWLLDQGILREKVIKIEDLKQISTIYAINSVQKWREVILEP